jgi:hypothetical protein
MYELCIYVYIHMYVHMYTYIHMYVHMWNDTPVVLLWLLAFCLCFSVALSTEKKEIIQNIEHEFYWTEYIKIKK